MRLSPLLLGFAALGFGWASPVLAQDGSDCGLLCQLGGYLSTDHMTAPPGDAAAGAGTPAKAHRAHAAHKAPAKPATQEVAHGAPPAAAQLAGRTVPAAATPVKSAAVKSAAARPGAPAVAKAESGKAVVAKAAVAPAVRTPAHGGATEAVAAAEPVSRPGKPGVRTAAKTEAKTRTEAKTEAKPVVRPAVVAAAPIRHAPAAPKIAAAETPAPDRGRAARTPDRAGGSVEIASASATPSPSSAAVPVKPVHTARAALPRRVPVAAPAQADRPVILLTALAAIPGSAPAISAGFQPATAH